MTYLDYLEQKVLLERLVIGLEEPVLIKGLGELSAKIDSGNGGYNVIHGTDFHQQGDELMFTTHDSFGHEKKMQAKVIDTIEVNMGGGNIESRPVIELDLKFAGEDYKKIPFSVSDRSTNSNPILISKGFVENELEALIDVGAMNISHEGRDVVYGEAAWDTIKSGLKGAGKGIAKGVANTASGLKNVGKTTLDGAKGLWNGLKNADKWLKGGDDVNLFAPTSGIKNAAKVGVGAFTATNLLSLTGTAVGLYALWHGAKGMIEFKKTQNMASSISKGNTIITDDYNKISKQLAGLTLQNNLVKDKEIDLSSNIVKQWSEKEIDPSKMPVSLVTSFMMTKGNIGDKKIIKGLETQREVWKDLIDSAKETTKVMKDEKGGNQSQEQEEFTESMMIFEDAQSELQNNGVPTLTATPVGNTAEKSTTPETDKPQGTNEDTTDPKQQVIENGEDKAEELKEITTQFEQLNTFTLWFISIENDKNKKEQIEKKIENLTDTLEKLEQEKESQKEVQKNTSDATVMKDSFNPFTKKEQNPEAIKAKIEQLKKSLNDIGLPDKSSSESSLQKFFLESPIDNIIYPLFKSGSVDSNSASNVVMKLAQQLQKDGKQGFFCLAWTPQSQTELKDDMKEVKREYFFFEKPDFIAYSKSNKSQEDEEWISSKLNFFKSRGII